MATPVIESTADSTLGSASTTFTITYPTGIAADDVLLLVGSVDNASTPADYVTGYPSGWTELFDDPDDDGFARGFLAYKKADGTETGTFNLTLSSSRPACARMYRISGAEDPATQAPEYVNKTDTGNSTTHDPPAITPAGGSADYLYFAFLPYDTYTVTVSTYPSGYTSTGDLQSGSSGAQCRLGYAVKSTTASTTENPSSYTLSSTRRSVVTTVAITPSGGGGPGPSVTPIPPRLANLDSQFATILAHKLGGHLQ